MFSLGILLIGAGIGLHVEESEGLEIAEVMGVAASLGEAIKTRTGTTPAIDEPTWSRCEAEDRCVPEIKQRLKAGDVIMMRVFGGPGSVRVVAERHGKFDRRGTITIDRATLPPPPSAFTSLAGALFQEVRPPAAQIAVVAPAVEAPAKRSWAPWVAFGAGALAAGAGTIFGVASLNTRSEIEAQIHDEPTFTELRDKQDGQATAAYLLFGVAVAGVVAGTLLLVLD